MQLSVMFKTQFKLLKNKIIKRIVSKGKNQVKVTKICFYVLFLSVF